ncbi:MAG: VOC family protein [Acidimicrobiales bacterium]
MKRMHFGLSVSNLDESVQFYSRLFGVAPTLERSDYAKWMLDDPYINFSVCSNSNEPPGVSHLGIQLETNAELELLRQEWDSRGLSRADQDDLVCGYQSQDKSWVYDPEQVPWEAFVTHGVTDGYGTNEMPSPS